jgi:hypothetical protein
MIARNWKTKHAAALLEEMTGISPDMLAWNFANAQDIVNNAGTKVVQKGICGIGIGWGKLSGGGDRMDRDVKLCKRWGITVVGTNGSTALGLPGCEVRGKMDAEAGTGRTGGKGGTGGG